MTKIIIKDKVKTDIFISRNEEYAYFYVHGCMKGVDHKVKVLIDIEDKYMVERGRWSLLPTNQNKFYLKSKALRLARKWRKENNK